MDRRGIRVFRVCAGLATGLIRAPVYDDKGRPARQRWTPPWSDERDRFDDPTRFVLAEVGCIRALSRRLKMGLPVPGANLLKASSGIMMMDSAINEAHATGMEAPSVGGFGNGGN
jgi:hypothetical protein